LPVTAERLRAPTGIICAVNAKPAASPLVLRPATRLDLNALLEFRLAMLEAVFPRDTSAPEPDPALLREANERWLSEHLGLDFQAWMADLDGRAVASAGLLWFPHPPGPNNPGGLEAYILNVYTRPEARGLGAARALMGLLVDAAKAAGVRRIWLRASEDGRSLYESMGFRAGNYLELTTD
jgi:ribosomal protein S18 acetylase RimI-like enzyme